MVWGTPSKPAVTSSANECHYTEARGRVAIVIGLWLQLAAAPDIGLPLAALALFIAMVIVAVLAFTELERDVVHMATLGAVLGGLVEAWLIGRTAWLHGALFGMVV